MLKLIALAVLGGCVTETDFDETTQAVDIDNGTSFNGSSLNGSSLNGSSLNGSSLNGSSLNGVSLNGSSLNGSSLNGVSLNGSSLNGGTLTGVRSDTGETITVAAVGVVMTGTASTGATVALRIDSAAPLAGDVWAYGVSFQNDVGWQPLCGDASITALAVMGTWNTSFGTIGGGSYTPSSTQFTFACRGKTIAKCVELGYKLPVYQAQLESCVRLLRGDYCGDGTSYTVSGHIVNLYDSVQVQQDTEHWLAEAEWTPSGARCISLDRLTRFGEYGLSPTCVVNKTLPATLGCATTYIGFKSGATLISELPYVKQP
jgi:hypothetical protein